MWLQKEIRLSPRPRGCHLITAEVLAHLPELAGCRVGVLNIFLKHTSASLTINENADPAVRRDLETFLSRTVKENEPYYQHDDEGPDDMPAHIKSSLLGACLTIPVTAGRLNMGLWQGIYLCEHRNHGGDRSLVLTLNAD